jgi:predicted Zn-dependent protease
MLLGVIHLAGCAPFAVMSESMFMMTPQEETVLGDKLKVEVGKQYRLNRMPDVNQYVAALGSKLWLYSPKGDFQPEFHVIDDDAINAFAIPGGGIYVNTGAILAAADEAELAGVIAHEIGHVVRRHGARAVSRQSGVNLLQQVLIGNESGEAAQWLGGLLSQGILFNYSREDELQSDSIAVGTLYRSGYDPNGLRTFFQTLQQRYGSGGGGPVAQLFASHPPTAERMSRVGQLVGELSDPPTSRPTAELRAIQARLPRPIDN